MRLALIRHAIAQPGENDFARALTGKGRRRFKRVVEGLERLGCEFDACLHSPKVRALETAELLRPLVTGPTTPTPLLARAPTGALLERLKGEQLALVGHEPHLSRLLAWLTTGRVDQDGAFDFKKGGVALLEGTPHPGSMRLLALLPPRLFR